MTARVLIVDDQELMRVGLRMVVDSQPDLTVVGEAATGAEGVAKAVDLRPDLVLMDVRMPEVDGIQIYRAIQARPSGESTTNELPRPRRR